VEYGDFMSTNRELKRLEGAKKLISEGMELRSDDFLLILANENKLGVVKYLVHAAKTLGIESLVVQIPEVFRPISKVPPALSAALNVADALIYVADRMLEEDFYFNRVLSVICRYREYLGKQPTKYCMMSNAKPRYFEEGIAADYKVVQMKCQKIAELLMESKKIEITSDTGTSISFSLYKEVLPRAPSYSYTFSSERARAFLPFLQAPEGEVMGCPIEDTFTGKLVVDGAISGVGAPPSPIIWSFERGQSVNVDGDEKFLSKLLRFIRRADSRVRSLRGIWVAEFSVGANDWAVLDDNFSNCEKVAGTFHIGIGHTEAQIGIERGEKFHFDCVVVNSNVTVIKRDNKKVELIRSGELLI